MAELLGVISGIVTIAEVGFEIYRALSKVASELGSSGHEIQLFSTEVRTFAEIMVLLRSTLLDQPRHYTGMTTFNQALDIVPGLLKQCELVYGCMLETLDTFKPELSSKIRLLARMKWAKDGKIKMTELRGFLEPLKSSLNLLISLLRNEVADAKHQPTIIR